jgi:pyruvate/2-oxoglutarate dehydrogenase complex dihydrolipoamide acyltransferase (E2) component
MFKKRLLLFALALAGAGAALQLTRGTATETPIKPPPYEPATRDKDGLIAAAGLVEAVAENTLLGSPTSGTVAKVHVKVWDKVKAGDPILTLDDRDLRAQHAVQKAAVEAAAATADRAADAARRWTGIKVGGVRRRADRPRLIQMAGGPAQAQAEARARPRAARPDRRAPRSRPRASFAHRRHGAPGRRPRRRTSSPPAPKAPVVLGDITRPQIRCDARRAARHAHARRPARQGLPQGRELPRRRQGPAPSPSSSSASSPSSSRRPRPPAPAS